MTPSDTITRRSDAIRQELDEARRRGSLQHIVIPPCPALLARLQAAMDHAEPDLTEIAAIASSDVAMAATLLRTANSPLNAVGQPAQTVGQAMNRLGLKETAAVLTGFLARQTIKADSPHLKRFWDRSAKRATCLSHIARQLPGLSTDLAHTYGLFCHVGQPVLLQSVKGYSATLVEAAARIDRPFIATENANHRTDHAVVGALVARVWKLAPEIMAAIRLHHDPEALGDSRIEPEVVTLMAAGHIAEHLMRRHESLSPDTDWATCAPRVLAWLQIGDDDWQQWEEQVTPALDAL